jgi:hypothetical protein
MNLKIDNSTSANRQTDFRGGIILLCSPKSKQIFAQTDTGHPDFSRVVWREATGVIP